MDIWNCTEEELLQYMEETFPKFTFDIKQDGEFFIVVVKYNDETVFYSAGRSKWVAMHDAIERIRAILAYEKIKSRG